MKFIVSRTSNWCDNERPCEEASLITIPRVETQYGIETPKEFDTKHPFAGGWLKTGTNHRVNENGYITRDVGFVNVWAIELNSLDELMTLYAKYGEIIFTESYINSAYKELEIYDSYRE